MASSLHTDIRTQIERVIAGELTLRDFYRWFVPVTWEIERNGSAAAVHLTHELAHLFSEFSAGDLTADEVIQQLMPLAETTALVKS